MITVHIGYDQDAPNPLEESGGWKLISFSRHHDRYQYSFEFMPLTENNYIEIGMRRKLDCGTAFLLDYNEHGGIEWYLDTSDYSVPWNTAGFGGILIYEGYTKHLPKTYEERQKLARSILEEYNDWVNGSVYGFCIEDENGDEEDSCWGYYGWEHMKEELERIIGGREYELAGEAKWIME